MILNEDYFKDLEIKDEDIVVDDTLDVEEPEHELTLEEAKKLSEQYNNLIRFQIDVADDRDTTFIQTTLIPRIFKRLDAIFELYGIEHSQYVLSSYLKVNFCDTVIKFGNYQLFCEECDRDYYRDRETGGIIYINAFVDYPTFNNKKVINFVYAIINIFKTCSNRSRQINEIQFIPNRDTNVTHTLHFYYEECGIYFHDYSCAYGYSLFLLSDDYNDYLSQEKEKINFYECVIHYFLGHDVKIIKEDALKLIKNISIKRHDNIEDYSDVLDDDIQL